MWRWQIRTKPLPPSSEVHVCVECGAADAMYKVTYALLLEVQKHICNVVYKVGSTEPNQLVRQHAACVAWLPSELWHEQQDIKTTWHLATQETISNSPKYTYG